MSVSFLSFELNLKLYRKKIRMVQEMLGVLATNLGWRTSCTAVEGGLPPPCSALAWRVVGSPFGPWCSHHGPSSTASAQGSSRRVLTVAFTSGAGGLQSTQQWRHISATLGGISRNVSK